MGSILASQGKWAEATRCLPPPAPPRAAGGPRCVSVKQLARRSVFRQALQTVIDGAGEETLLGATLLNNLGLCHARQGEPRKAQNLYERAIAVRTKLLGPAHPEVSASAADFRKLSRKCCQIHVKS